MKTDSTSHHKSVNAIQLTCPTCLSGEMYPLSTAALLAPTAPPKASAKVSNIAKFSALFIPRPPDTTTRAVPRSGRSLFVDVSDTKTDSVADGCSTMLRPFTISAEFDSSKEHLSKEVGRISMNYGAFISINTTSCKVNRV